MIRSRVRTARTAMGARLIKVERQCSRGPARYPMDTEWQDSRSPPNDSAANRNVFDIIEPALETASSGIQNASHFRYFR